MASADFAKGMVAAAAMLMAEHDRLEAEHLRLRPNVWGGPRRRHNEIMVQARILTKLNGDIHRAARAALKEST
ncbi:hypothetical protein [Hyphomicrobium sp.]|uniref:hypothetical protein n=1 Tax=Hyphomicrobium sp. TaxID=82 RepID=UPI001D77B11E|nr:hypothetical protein [Hyphomicrobium sp.]MBY0559891.1 hypothetical protein [Hyphomicrobium sp.]